MPDRQDDEKRAKGRKDDMPWWTTSWAGHLVTEENIEGRIDEKERRNLEEREEDMPWWRTSWAGHLVTEENVEETKD